MWRYCERRGAEVGGRIAASAGFAVLHRRARSSTGQSIGLRIRPSPVTQRDIASSEETETLVPEGFSALSPNPLILSESLEIDSTPVATAQHMPNYFGLAKAEYFSKVRCSAVTVRVGHKFGTGRRRRLEYPPCVTVGC